MVSVHCEVNSQYFQLLMEGIWRENHKKESKVTASSDVYMDINKKNCVNSLWPI